MLGGSVLGVLPMLSLEVSYIGDWQSQFLESHVSRAGMGIGGDPSRGRDNDLIYVYII